MPEPLQTSQMKGNNNQAIGAVGEAAAVRYLVRAGHVVLDRNWRCWQHELRGELDIVARDGATIVFCEVKTRRGTRFGHPVEAVVPAKARRIHQLALVWLSHNQLRSQGMRFDVIGVWLRSSGVHLDHIRSAF